MPHVFVETNWLFAYAAPAHHQIPEAAELLERARLGEFTVHIPNVCIGEARQAILTKCQPRSEAKAIRRFLAWAQPAGRVTSSDVEATRIVVDKFESSIERDLESLAGRLRMLAELPYVKMFGLDDAMLERATELALAGIAPRPFDHAILAGVLVRASGLWNDGERAISFCENDADLQPWDKQGNAKPSLKDAFDQAHVWVFGDFTLTWPERRRGFE